MSAAVEIIETSSKSDANPTKSERDSAKSAKPKSARRKIVRRRGAARLVQIPSSGQLEDAFVLQTAATERAEARRRTDASSLPASLLGGLREVALVLQLRGVEGRVRVLTCREALEEARDGASIVFDEGEWAALVTAAESDRVWPQDIAAFCARKAADPRWTLDLDTALAGARADAPRGWSVGRVLERLGAQLVAAS